MNGVLAHPRLRLGPWGWGAMLCCAFLAPAGHGGPRAETILIRARRLHPVAGPAVDAGAVLVRDGKIAAAGKEGADVILPAGEPVRVLEVDGTVVPGFIDTASDIGVRGRAAEEFRELTPEMRVLDAVDLEHPDFERALQSGVTAAAVSPGGRNVVGGLGVVVRTAPVAPAARLLKADAFLDASLSEDAASGNQSLRFARPSSYVFRLPNTRMGTVFLLRRAFIEALEKAAPPAAPPAAGGTGSAAGGTGPAAGAPGAAAPEAVARDAGRGIDEVGALSPMLLPEGKETLRRSAGPDLTLRIWADYEQEVLTAFRFMDEFKLRLQVIGAAEAAASIPELAARGVPVMLYAGTNFRERELDRYPRYSARLAALLAARAVPFAFYSGNGAEVALLPGRVGMTLRFGLSTEQALRAATLDAARLLGIDGRVGSLEPGKEADIVAFSGEPFDATADVVWVMSAGEFVYHREITRSF